MSEQRTYGLYELEGWLASYEHRYRLASEDFYRLHLDDSVELLKMRRIDRHIWASYYREAKEIMRRRREATMSDLLDSDGPNYDPEAYAEMIDLARKRERENPPPPVEPESESA